MNVGMVITRRAATEVAVFGQNFFLNDGAPLTPNRRNSNLSCVAIFFIVYLSHQIVHQGFGEEG